MCVREKNILISFIIPVWNREHTISYCLDSILSQLQDKNQFEIIIVDDCSTDTSLSIINRIISCVTSSEIVFTDFPSLLPILYENHTSEPQKRI